MTNTETAQIARDHLGIEYCPRASCRACFQNLFTRERSA